MNKLKLCKIAKFNKKKRKNPDEEFLVKHL